MSKNSHSAESGEDDDLSEYFNDHKKLLDYYISLESNLFELKKNSLLQPKKFVSKKRNLIHKQANSLGKLNHLADRTKIENILSCYRRFTGIVVDSFSSKFCIIKYNVNCAGKSMATFAIEMLKVGEPDNWILSKYNLPLGFHIDSIENKHEPMTREYILEIQTSLYAHFNRLWQIEKTKKILPNCAEIQHSLNGTHIEIVAKLKCQNENGKDLKMVCLLKYDTMKIRPDDIQISNEGISDGSCLAQLKNQIKPFKTLTLDEAFQNSFQNPNNLYKCYTQEEYIMNERNSILFNGNNNGNKRQWMNFNSGAIPNCSQNKTNINMLSLRGTESSSRALNTNNAPNSSSTDNSSDDEQREFSTKVPRKTRVKSRDRKKYFENYESEEENLPKNANKAKKTKNQKKKSINHKLDKKSSKIDKNSSLNSTNSSISSSNGTFHKPRGRPPKNPQTIAMRKGHSK